MIDVLMRIKSFNRTFYCSFDKTPAKKPNTEALETPIAPRNQVDPLDPLRPKLAVLQDPRCIESIKTNVSDNTQRSANRE